MQNNNLTFDSGNVFSGRIQEAKDLNMPNTTKQVKYI